MRRLNALRKSHGGSVEHIVGNGRDAMNMVTEYPEKVCPAFKKQESIIKEIIDNINRVAELPEKAKLAKKLQSEVNVLLTCPDYSGKKTDCKNCRCIAKLRNKTADFFLRAANAEKKTDDRQCSKK